MASHEPRSCDLLIENGCVLTMDARRTIFPRGAIAVKGHTIADVGAQEDIHRAWRASTVIDAKGGARIYLRCVARTELQTA